MSGAVLMHHARGVQGSQDHWSARGTLQLQSERMLWGTQCCVLLVVLLHVLDVLHLLLVVRWHVLMLRQPQRRLGRHWVCRS